MRDQLLFADCPQLYYFRPMWCAVDWILFSSNSSVFVKDWVCCLEVVGSFLFVKWVLFRVHNCCFCIKKLLRSMSSSEHVLLVRWCWRLCFKKPPLLQIRQKNYTLICNCWTHWNHTFHVLISFCQLMTWTLQLQEQHSQRRSDSPWDLFNGSSIIWFGGACWLSPMRPNPQSISLWLSVPLLKEGLDSERLSDHWWRWRPILLSFWKNEARNSSG